jgi:hypothetical protein
MQGERLPLPAWHLLDSAAHIAVGRYHRRND